MFSRCLPTSTRQGLTLIEVVVSLGLLSTLLVGILVAYHRHAERIRTSQECLSALDGIDELMCLWTSQGVSVPYPAHGDLPGKATLAGKGKLAGKRRLKDQEGGNGKKRLVWKTEVINTRYHKPLGIDLVRLSVFHEGHALDKKPITSIDLAVPYVKRKKEDTP